MTKDAYNPVRATEETRSQLDVARTRLYETGAIDLIQSVASVLPGTSSEVVDNFDKAGGKGMPPFVILRGHVIEQAVNEDERSKGEKL